MPANNLFLMANPEHFHATSTFFNQIPWRTDLLSAPCSLNRLDTVPEVLVNYQNVSLFSAVAQLETFVGISCCHLQAGEFAPFQLYVPFGNGRAIATPHILSHRHCIPE
jgi:hypothetical protein